MTSIQHDSALEEAAAALNLKGVKMSDILAATEREEAKKRKPELYHRSDTSVDAGLASTAPTGAKARGQPREATTFGCPSSNARRDFAHFPFM